MKQVNRYILTRLSCIVFMTFAMTTVPSAHAHTCSQATGAGQWAFTVSGSVILPNGAAVPVMQVGSFREDREGNFNGSQTRSLGGGVSKETFAGTASIHSDCSGTATTAPYDESGAVVRTTTVDFVLDEDGNHARSIVTSVVLPNGTSVAPLLTIDYRRVFSRQSN